MVTAQRNVSKNSETCRNIPIPGSVRLLRTGATAGTPYSYTIYQVLTGNTKKACIQAKTIFLADCSRYLYTNCRCRPPTPGSTAAWRATSWARARAPPTSRSAPPPAPPPPPGWRGQWLCSSPWGRCYEHVMSAANVRWTLDNAAACWAHLPRPELVTS